MVDAGASVSEVHARYSGVTRATMKQLYRIAKDRWVREAVMNAGVSYTNAITLLSLPEKQRNIGAIDAATRLTQRSLKQYIKERHACAIGQDKDRYLGSGIHPIENPDTKRALDRLEEESGAASIRIATVRLSSNAERAKYSIEIVAWGFDQATDLIERFDLDALPRNVDVLSRQHEAGRRCTIYVQCTGITEVISTLQWMIKNSASTKQEIDSMVGAS